MSQVWQGHNQCTNYARFNNNFKIRENEEQEDNSTKHLHDNMFPNKEVVIR